MPIDKIHRRLAEIRADSDLASRLIPAYLVELALSELDDVITAAWIMTARVAVDRQLLLEMDALGSALDLEGCTTAQAHAREKTQ